MELASWRGAATARGRRILACRRYGYVMGDVGNGTFGLKYSWSELRTGDCDGNGSMAVREGSGTPRNSFGTVL